MYVEVEKIKDRFTILTTEECYLWEAAKAACDASLLGQGKYFFTGCEESWAEIAPDGEKLFIHDEGEVSAYSLPDFYSL
jgi:hypothetical protein